MTPALFVVLLSSPAQLFGQGGVFAPPQPVVQVSRQSEQDKAADLHGPYLWTWAQGLDPLLDSAHQKQLAELRDKKIMLTSIGMACASLGGLVAVGSLFSTPNFVNVLHPSPGGLTLPIVLASGGLVLAIAAAPLFYLSPGDEALAALIADNNKGIDNADKKLVLLKSLSTVLVPTQSQQVIYR